MKHILFLVVLLAFALFVFCIAFAGCESNQTPESFVIDKLKENLHDPKSLEIISITPFLIKSCLQVVMG